MIARERSRRTCLICFGIVLLTSTCEHCPDLGQRWPEEWVGVDSPTQLRYLCCSKWRLFAKLGVFEALSWQLAWMEFPATATWCS